VSSLEATASFTWSFTDTAQTRASAAASMPNGKKRLAGVRSAAKLN
jgi:hypothetical protein